MRRGVGKTLSSHVDVFVRVTKRPLCVAAIGAGVPYRALLGTPREVVFGRIGDQRLEVPCQIVGQVECPQFSIGQGVEPGISCEEAVAVRPGNPL